MTQFFRDPAAFDALSQYVFPAISESRSTKQPIRIWVPGCATGEEVYSIAIALLEHLGDRTPTPGIQLFGTDVSDAALQIARGGEYHVNLLHDVSAERLDRFFLRQNGAYRIAKHVRDLCLFARQDVTHDPPFSRLDLISCRNVLIYLDAFAQRRVMRTFHYALRPQGMLFFGPAENVALSSELFEQTESRSRVFRRRPNTGRGAIAEQEHASDWQAPEPEGHVSLHGEADALPREADRLLLARFAPACVLVNEAFTIQQFRGQTGPYLEPAGGPPSFDLRRVLRPELLAHVIPAIGETSKTGVASRRDVQLGEREIDIEVIPLAGWGKEKSFLILFDGRSLHAAARTVSAPAAALTESEKDRRLAQLERELEGLSDYIRAAVEDHGAVQEELRSAHEEMLSANEEFQSTNEELETSKEELQSTNEELTTTIDELRSRNQELAVVNAALDAARLISDSALSYSDVIIETVREPLAVLDGTLQILRVNAAFAASLQVPRKEIEGRNLREVGDGRWNIPEMHQKLRALLADGQPLEDWELTLDLPQQNRRVMSLSARRIPGGGDRAEQLLLALEDVTARAIMAGLLASDERKDQFIAMLGHELRHPLTPIAHAIYLLRQGKPDQVAVELLDTIDTQTQTLVRFVNELLDLARIRRGQIEVRPERLDFVALVRDAVQGVQLFVEEARQHVLSLVLPSAPMYVHGDSGRLRQVVINLLENAAKYTDPGGQITITLEQRDDKAELRVRDTGIGIASENLERIFEPFTHSHKPLADPSNGLGIGLTIVRRILELHGGQITAISAGVGMGSEFVLSLPVTLTDTVDDTGSENRAKPPVPPVTNRLRKVMIVDDHEEMRKSTARLVRAWGHEVAVANDGPSALSLAEAFQPECAIVDLSMPGMNGVELARRLRQRFPPAQLYLIAMTGYAGDDIRDGCLAAGFNAHMVKPGDIQLLQKLLGSDGADSDTRSR